MKSTKIILAICTLAISTFFTFGLNKSMAQTTSPTYTITLNGSDLASTSALNITYSTSANDFSPASSITFMGTGASLLLSNVDTSKKVISLVWNGAVTDGTITITGNLTGNVNSSSAITVTKVEKSGGANITSSVQATSTITGTTQPTTSSSGNTSGTTSGSTGTSSGSTNTSSGGTSSGETASEPSVSIKTVDSVLIKSKRVSPIKVKITGANFTGSSKCTITTSDDSLGRARPNKVVLNKVIKSRFIFVRIPPKTVKDFLENGLEDSLVIDVTCNNGATEAAEILITTDSESIEPVDEPIVE
jgi:hypothetical protein